MPTFDAVVHTNGGIFRDNAQLTLFPWLELKEGTKVVITCVVGFNFSPVLDLHIFPRHRFGLKQTFHDSLKLFAAYLEGWRFVRICGGLGMKIPRAYPAYQADWYPYRDPSEPARPHLELIAEHPVRGYW